MTVEIFLILLTFFSVVTSLATEAAKIFLDSVYATYQSNVLVLIVAAIVGGNGMVIFYLCNNYQWTATNIICIFLMIFANWLGAMVGYDKVRQAITQFKGGN
jgi:hypothetical protein